MHPALESLTIHQPCLQPLFLNSLLPCAGSSAFATGAAFFPGIFPLDFAAPAVPATLPAFRTTVVAFDAFDAALTVLLPSSFTVGSTPRFARVIGAALAFFIAAAVGGFVDLVAAPRVRVARGFSTVLAVAAFVMPLGAATAAALRGDAALILLIVMLGFRGEVGCER